MRKFIILAFPLTLLFQYANCQTISDVIQPVEPVIDNGILTLKLDLTRGGAISYLSLSGSDRSVVNIADEGRYIQQSYLLARASTAKQMVSHPTGHHGHGTRYRLEMLSATGHKSWPFKRIRMSSM